MYKSIVRADIISLQIPDTIIGIGAINNVGDVVKKFAPARVLIITDPGIVKAGLIKFIISPLNKAGYKFDIFDDCESEPSITCIEALAHRVKVGQYDILIGIGGGSVLDATKVISIIAVDDSINVYDLINGKLAEKTIRKILIPTTSGSGSEWSRGAVVYDDKVEGMAKLVLTPLNYPDAVIIDPQLTVNLPPRITADTGIDALTHCIEGYFGAKSNILSDMLNGTAIKLIADNLRLAYYEGKKNIEARYNMSIAASLANKGGGLSSGSLAHAMNEPLGQKAQISHGTACGLLLPQVMKFNLAGSPAKFANIAKMMGEDVHNLPTSDAAAKSVEAVQKLLKDLGMPRKLSDATNIKLKESDIPAMVEHVVKALPRINSKNSRKASAVDVTKIFRLALWGDG